jgi:hypothetical protein
VFFVVNFEKPGGLSNLKKELSKGGNLSVDNKFIGVVFNFASPIVPGGSKHIFKGDRDERS